MLQCLGSGIYKLLKINPVLFQFSFSFLSICHIASDAGANAAYADQMPKLVKELGVDRLHVLWPFQRGRAIEEGQNDDLIPSVDRLIDGYRNIRAAALEAGITFFTYETWKVRIDGPPGLKYDLANHCWSSLCLYTDGNVFPSPALTQHPELSLGNVGTSTLRDLNAFVTWKEVV